PRVNKFLPVIRILEIAPGRGRWTQYLLQHCTEYVGAELSENCVQTCRQRFASANRARFMVNDGQSLRVIPDNSIDFVFSLILLFMHHQRVCLADLSKADHTE